MRIYAWKKNKFFLERKPERISYKKTEHADLCLEKKTSFSLRENQKESVIKRQMSQTISG